MDKLKDFLKRNGVSILKISFVVLIVIFIITGITKEIKSIDFAETTMLIRSLSIP